MKDRFGKLFLIFYASWNCSYLAVHLLIDGLLGFVNRFYHICDITNMYKGLDDQVEVTMGLVGELLVGMQHHGGETVNIRRPVGSSTAERK